MKQLCYACVTSTHSYTSECESDSNCLNVMRSGIPDFRCSDVDMQNITVIIVLGDEYRLAW